MATEMLLQATLTVMLAFPAYSLEREDSEARRARLTDVAEAICATTNGHRTRTAALVTLWWRESSGAAYVQAGCREVPKGAPDCDGGLAATPWQLHHPACPQLRDLVPGSREWLFAGARCADRQMVAAYWRCHLGWWGAFSGYAGIRCDQPWAEKRSHDMGDILARIRKAMVQ
jgi:hypothetical protein